MIRGKPGERPRGDHRKETRPTMVNRKGLNSPHVRAIGRATSKICAILFETGSAAGSQWGRKRPPGRQQ